MATRSAPVIAHRQGRLGLRSDDNAILYSTDLKRTTVRHSLFGGPHACAIQRLVRTPVLAVDPVQLRRLRRRADRGNGAFLDQRGRAASVFDQPELGRRAAGGNGGGALLFGGVLGALQWLVIR
jgi:hypothetical protein